MRHPHHAHREAQGPIASLLARTSVSDRARRQVQQDPMVTRWTRSLPGHLSVQALQRCCPQALRLLARHWEVRRNLEDTFKHLMYRGGHANAIGLDIDALNELAELQEYAIAVVHRKRLTVWDSLR